MALLTPEEFVTRTGWTVPVAILFRELPDTDPAGAALWDALHYALGLADPSRTHWCLGPSGVDRTVMLRQRRQMVLLRGALRHGAAAVSLHDEQAADHRLVAQAAARRLPPPAPPVLRRTIADNLSDVAIDPADLGECWMVAATVGDRR